MEKILIASGKGGVGKSTMAVCLANALCARGKRVLLADCDVGLRSLDLLTGLGSGAVYSWLDLLLENCTAADALLQDEKKPLALLTAPNRLETPLEPFAFSEMLSVFDADFDFCLLDAGAGLSDLLTVFGGVADRALLVATPDAVSARAAAAAAELLQETTLSAENLRLVLNRYGRQDVRYGTSLSADEMIDATALQLLGAVPEDVHLRGLSRGETAASPAAEAFARIAARLCGETVPFREKKLKSVLS